MGNGLLRETSPGTSAPRFARGRTPSLRPAGRWAARNRAPRGLRGPSDLKASAPVTQVPGGEPGGHVMGTAAGTSGLRTGLCSRGRGSPAGDGRGQGRDQGGRG